MLVKSLLKILCLFLEAWHSIREPNAINEHIYIPDIYKALGNPKWRFCGSFKHSFAFVSHFIAEEGYSILTETFSHKKFFSQWQQKKIYFSLKSLLVSLNFFILFSCSFVVLSAIRQATRPC